MDRLMSASNQEYAVFADRRAFIERTAAAGLTFAAGLALAGCDKGDKKEGDNKPVELPASPPPPPGRPVEGLMDPSALPDIVESKPGADGKEPPVTIVEYASMTCSHCAAFHATTYPVLRSKYIDTGKVRFILREFPLDPLATAAFMLARCAGPDKRDAMIGLLFQLQRNWAGSNKPIEELAGLVKQTGMSQETFQACLNNEDLRKKIDEVHDRGELKFGVDATPTFYINGVKHSGEILPDELDKLLAPLLKE
jgi:protein-disulfide isomerase